MAQPYRADPYAQAMNSNMASSHETSQLQIPGSEAVKRKLCEEDVEDSTSTSKKKKAVFTGKPRKIKRKECVTCCNDVAINRFPKLPHKSAQKHGRDVCIGCWEQYLKSEINSKGWNSICCPLCDDVLEETEIKKLTKDDTYGA